MTKTRQVRSHITDAQFLARAREHYHVDGEVEFDDDAQVAQSYIEYGAYVQAWVWVEFPEEKADPMRRTEMHQ